MISAVRTLSDMLQLLGFKQAIGEPLPENLHDFKARLFAAKHRQLTDTTIELRTDPGNAIPMRMSVSPIEERLHLNVSDHHIALQIAVHDDRLYLVIKTLNTSDAPMGDDEVEIFHLHISDGKLEAASIPVEARGCIEHGAGYRNVPFIWGFVLPCIPEAAFNEVADAWTIRAIRNSKDARPGSRPRLIAAV